MLARYFHYTQTPHSIAVTVSVMVVIVELAIGIQLKNVQLQICMNYGTDGFCHCYGKPFSVWFQGINQMLFF